MEGDATSAYSQASSMRYQMREMQDRQMREMQVRQNALASPLGVGTFDNESFPERREPRRHVEPIDWGGIKQTLFSPLTSLRTAVARLRVNDEPQFYGGIFEKGNNYDFRGPYTKIGAILPLKGWFIFLGHSDAEKKYFPFYMGAFWDSDPGVINPTFRAFFRNQAKILKESCGAVLGRDYSLAIKYEEPKKGWSVGEKESFAQYIADRVGRNGAYHPYLSPEELFKLIREQRKDPTVRI